MTSAAIANRHMIYTEILAATISAAGTIASRASITTVDTYPVSKHGFTWQRRN